MKSKGKKKPGSPVDHVIRISLSKKDGLHVEPPIAHVAREFPVAWEYAGPGAATLVFAPHANIEVIRATADRSGPAIAIPHGVSTEVYAVVRLPESGRKRERSMQGGRPKDLPDHCITAVLIVMERGAGD